MKPEEQAAKLAAATAALEAVHAATRSGGLYVSRDESTRPGAMRAIDQVRKVLGITPSTDLEEKT